MEQESVHGQITIYRTRHKKFSWMYRNDQIVFRPLKADYGDVEGCMDSIRQVMTHFPLAPIQDMTKDGKG